MAKTFRLEEGFLSDTYGPDVIVNRVPLSYTHGLTLCKVARLNWWRMKSTCDIGAGLSGYPTTAEMPSALIRLASSIPSRG